MRIRNQLFALAAMLFSLAGFTRAGTDPLSLRVTPAVAFAPTSIHVYVTLEANDENRALEISLDSPDYYRSSEIQLEGSRAPRLVPFEFRDVPDGDYQVTARLVRDAGEPAIASGSVRLVPTGSR